MQDPMILNPYHILGVFIQPLDFPKLLEAEQRRMKRGRRGFAKVANALYQVMQFANRTMKALEGPLCPLSIYRSREVLPKFAGAQKDALY